MLVRAQILHRGYILCYILIPGTATALACLFRKYKIFFACGRAGGQLGDVDRLCTEHVMPARGTSRVLYGRSWLPRRPPAFSLVKIIFIYFLNKQAGAGAVHGVQQNGPQNATFVQSLSVNGEAVRSGKVFKGTRMSL